MPYKNKQDKYECNRRYQKTNKLKMRVTKSNWRRNNKDKVKRYRDNTQAERQRWYTDYKKTLKCSRCPEDHPACLEFHHLDGKKFIIGRKPKVKSIKMLKAEISKCVVLCANCHRKEHYDNRRQNNAKAKSSVTA